MWTWKVAIDEYAAKRPKHGMEALQLQSFTAVYLTSHRRRGVWCGSQEGVALCARLSQPWSSLRPRLRGDARFLTAKRTPYPDDSRCERRGRREAAFVVNEGGLDGSHVGETRLFRGGCAKSWPPRRLSHLQLASRTTTTQLPPQRYSKTSTGKATQHCSSQLELSSEAHTVAVMLSCESVFVLPRPLVPLCSPFASQLRHSLLRQVQGDQE